MKIKTSELTGPALDWAVAKLEFPEHDDEALAVWVTPLPCDDPEDFKYQPSTDWAQGGPLIGKAKISLAMLGDTYYSGIRNPDPMVCDYTGTGPASNPLIAICRCFVASKLGDEVDVP